MSAGGRSAGKKGRRQGKGERTKRKKGTGESALFLSLCVCVASRASLEKVKRDAAARAEHGRQGRGREGHRSERERTVKGEPSTPPSATVAEAAEG